MTEVVINSIENSIELKGHSTEKHVCHALSALSASVAIRLQEKVNARTTIGSDHDAYLKIEPPENACNADIKYYEDYIDFLIESIETIDVNYPDNIIFIVS